jgi:hypothetical protein
MAANFAQIWSEIQEKHKFGTKVPFLTFPQIFQRGAFFWCYFNIFKVEKNRRKNFCNYFPVQP